FAVAFHQPVHVGGLSLHVRHGLYLGNAVAVIVVEFGALDLAPGRRELKLLPRLPDLESERPGILVPDDTLYAPRADNDVRPAIAVDIVRQIAIGADPVLGALVGAKGVRLKVGTGEPVRPRNDIRLPVAIDIGDACR